MDGMEIPRVTSEEAKKRLDEGEAILIVRVSSCAAYAPTFIQGAVTRPENEAEDRYRELPSDRTIICY